MLAPGARHRERHLSPDFVRPEVDVFDERRGTFIRGCSMVVRWPTQDTDFHAQGRRLPGYCVLR